MFVFRSQPRLQRPRVYTVQTQPAKGTSKNSNLLNRIGYTRC